MFIPFLLTCLMFALLASRSDTRATGFRILDHNASATGQSSAFTAQADDPSAVYYNALGDTTVGLAVLSPFGNLFRYADNGPFSTAVTHVALQLIDIKPTLAYKLNEQLSVELGADIYTSFSFWGQGQSETRLNSPGTGGLPPSPTPLEVNGKDTAAGFNVSLMYTPFLKDNKPLLNVGLVYRSQATLHLNTDVHLSSGATLPFP